MNFIKAFDSLNNDQLVNKPRTLSRVGIKERKAECFSTYLQQKKQLVEIPQTKRRQ